MEDHTPTAKRQETQPFEASEATMHEIETILAQWERERPDIQFSAFLIAGAITQINQEFENAFRALGQNEFGIGTGDLRILLALRRSGPDRPQRPTDLFQSLLITSGAVTKQVDRLVAKGLVDRVADPTYQRGWLIHLTKKGTRVADRAIEAICTPDTKIGAAIAGLSDKDRKAGAAFLRRLLAELARINS
jgi:DNA-binding MarR family transcriptional regulator